MFTLSLLCLVCQIFSHQLDLFLHLRTFINFTSITQQWSSTSTVVQNIQWIDLLLFSNSFFCHIGTGYTSKYKSPRNNRGMQYLYEKELKGHKKDLLCPVMSTVVYTLYCATRCTNHIPVESLMNNYRVSADESEETRDYINHRTIQSKACFSWHGWRHR